MIPVSSSVGSSSDGEHVISGDPKDLATLDLVSEGQLLYDGHSLWLKKDGGFVPVSDHGEHVLTGDPSNPPEELQVGQLLYDGIDGDSGGGVFDGEHVLTGDPNDPPEGWAAGQLLYDGVEDTGGSGDGSGGGDGGHIRVNDDEYTPMLILEAEEATGWPNYDGGPADWLGARLLLTGDPDKGLWGDDATSEAAILAEDVVCQGWRADSSWVNTDLRVFGDLQVDGVTTVTGLDAKANGSSSPTNPNITFGTSGVNAQTGFYRNSTGAIQVACEGEPVFRFGKAQSRIYNDLQIDGAIAARVGGSADDPAYGFVDMPGAGMFAHKANNWLRFAVAGEAQMRIDTEKVTIWKALRVEGTFNPVGGTAFGITEGIDTADVLDRAETATMPAPDAEGVATADVEAESLTVNEVMTAMLAKIKELSAEIEELKGN